MYRHYIQESNKIIDSLKLQPASIAELASLIGRNWRTADKIVENIALTTGQIATKIFRKGSRGALKVAFWTGFREFKGTSYSEKLLQELLLAHDKHEFSTFDIYQYCNHNKSSAIRSKSKLSKEIQNGYCAKIKQAKRQILFFSGNLSWIREHNLFQLFEELLEKQVEIKIITRIDITSADTVDRLLSLNKRANKDLIEIRHSAQALRGSIQDSEICYLKEIQPKSKNTELKSDHYIQYIIKDIEWIRFIENYFWKIWSQSVSAKDRLNALTSIADI